MRSNVRDKKRLAGFATILTSLLFGMTFAVVNSTYAASTENNVVAVQGAAVHPVLPPKALVFPVVAAEAVEPAVVKADSKALANSDARVNPFFVRNPFFFRAPFFFDEPFGEFD
ncbi:MAG TPA: hypothetical protein VN642_05410 [Dongiaceae bacterium]|nr:hypothetical protein [Dongiaceae bacterium]